MLNNSTVPLSTRLTGVFLSYVLYTLFSSFLARSGGSAQVAKLLSVFGQICVEECKEGRQQVRDEIKQAGRTRTYVRTYYALNDVFVQINTFLLNPHPVRFPDEKR